MKNIAIIFAGGSGVRMGSGLPKQFLEINGQPIIIYTLEIFDDHPDIDAIYVACKEEYIPMLKKYVRRYQLQKIAGIVPGGTTGMDSIYNALTAAKAENDGDSIVLIHDGVRPFIPHRLITDCIRSVEEKGSAITCTPMFETPIRSADGTAVEEVVPRDQMFTAQAPQCFRLDDILAAHDSIRPENPMYEGIVDSCSMMKKLGREVSIVKGNRGNIKVTTPEDLYLFRGLLTYRETEQSFGLAEGETIERLRR